MDLSKLRNIGISAHIDSGKTTLSERILFYAGRIHRMQEVKGGDGGASMDYMELERERGITITSAATTVSWDGVTINLIDTPGHVDFTVEVERSLRVLDGAVLVLCSVGGVQAQSLTINRQMARYRVPRIAFINKMDRIGANPFKVVDQMRDRLGCDTVMIQLPIGAGETFEGVIDLITQEMITFDGVHGEKVIRQPIPAEHQERTDDYRQQMLETLSMYSDELMEMLLAEEEVPEDLIHTVLHDAVLQLTLTPVMLGTAYKNKGVQLLLDAVIKYLPNPTEVEVKAQTLDEQPFPLKPDPNAPFVGMAFKIVEDAYGTLTFVRIYQGTIKKGEFYYNQRTGIKQRFSRIVRMHADQREDVDDASAGDIVAVLGMDTASGDTYASDYPLCTLESIFVPDPVIKMAISPKQREGTERLSKALQRFRREDPTFQVSQDEESGETLIAGMGELHLDVYIERIKREYKLEVEIGAPKVNYREAPMRPVEFNHKHKKQTGGSGQFGHIVGSMEPLPEDAEELFIFEEKVVQGRIPKNYIPAIEKGFRKSLDKGPVAGFPVVGIKVNLTDGSYHDVDSSDMAFETCARGCFREYFMKMKPALLEPIMKVEVECPAEYQGNIVGDLTSRRGIVLSTETEGVSCKVEAEVPLAETFAYNTTLKSLTSGKGEFSMEFLKYRQVPSNLQEEIVAERKAALVGAT